MAFVHLHNHTQYSVLDGACRTDKVGELAKSMGMTAVAMTDHGNLYGTVDFIKNCGKIGIKPIIGSEVYIVENDFNHPNTREDFRYHLVLLVKNKIGYKNLCKLSSKSYIEGFYIKPRINRSLLRKHHEGLICLSACIQGEIPNKLRKKLKDDAMEALYFYKDVFGDDFYIELQNHGLEEELFVMPQLIEIAKETSTKMIVTNDCHYLHKRDSEAHDVLLCIQTGKLVKDEDRLKYPNNMYFKSEEEMRKLFPDIPEAITNTIKIADEVDFKLSYEEFMLPKIDIPTKYSNHQELLKDLCYSNVKYKYPELTPEIERRINYELEVISKMGFSSYFLVVKDLIDSSRTKGISVGPGRGSAAGSIVSFLLDITRIDPLKYNLLFERFLNSERVEMPDIDIDFCASRRAEVIDYIIEKYGRDSVTQIITYGTLGAKSVIKDIARVMGISPSEANTITKLMSPKPNINLEKNLETQPDFEKAIHNNDIFRDIYNKGRVIEGLVRQIGVHAAGIVIGPGDLSDYVPLAISNQKDNEHVVLVQFEGKWLNDLKMLKMDILSLNTLTIIQKAIKLIKKYKGIDLDIEKIDLTDTNTFTLLSNGLTDGVFQLESVGMKKYLRDLRPNTFEDIVAMVALYRPGPLQFIEPYINRKHGKERVVYDHPLVEEVLKETYGVIVYQEQVMQMSRKMAGLTGYEAEKLRKAMGKKDKEAMLPLKEKFKSGALANGVSEKIIEKTWTSWEKFAEYAFNKSHSVCYAYVAFQTAFLKAHYPIEYMTALLSLEDNTAKIPLYVDDARNLGIKLLLPSINKSNNDFEIIDDKILFGFSAIKNIGEATVEAILNERNKNGIFHDYFSFVERVESNALNKTALEALIKSGALDDFEGFRAQKFAAIENALYLSNYAQSAAQSGQVTLFDMMTPADKIDNKPQLPRFPEWDEGTLLENEKMVLGLYLSGHPLDNFRHLIHSFTNIDTKEFALENVTIPEKIKIIGIIKNIINKQNKKKDIDLQIISLEDLYGRFEMTLFKDQIRAHSHRIATGNKLFIIGTQSMFQGNNDEKILKIIPTHILDIEELNDLKGEITIGIEEKEATIEFAKILVENIKKYPGNLRLTFRIRMQDGKKVMLKPNINNFSPHKEFINDIVERRNLSLENTLEIENIEQYKKEGKPKFGYNNKKKEQ